jgi:hypothetical protein
MSDRELRMRGHLSWALHDLEKIFQRYGADQSIPRFVVLRVELESVRESLRGALGCFPPERKETLNPSLYEGENGG